MKAILLIGGLFLIVLPLFSLRDKLAQYETQKNGQIVSATITRVPDCKGTTGGFMEFDYQGKLYSKKVSCRFSDNHQQGDAIRLKYLDKTGMFLFEQEHMEGELVAFGILPIIGVICIICGLRTHLAIKPK